MVWMRDAATQTMSTRSKTLFANSKVKPFLASANFWTHTAPSYLKREKIRSSGAGRNIQTTCTSNEQRSKKNLSCAFVYYW
jgi:protein subunit release factor B